MTVLVGILGKCMALYWLYWENGTILVAILGKCVTILVGILGENIYL